MTRGHDGWLHLSCKKLPFSTLYRFSSALSQRPLLQGLLDHESMARFGFSSGLIANATSPISPVTAKKGTENTPLKTLATFRRKNNHRAERPPCHGKILKPADPPSRQHTDSQDYGEIYDYDKGFHYHYIRNTSPSSHHQHQNEGNRHPS